MNKELIEQINRLTQIAYQIHYEYELIKIPTKDKHKYLKDIPDEYKKDIYIIRHRCINNDNTQIYIKTLYQHIKDTYKNTKLINKQKTLLNISEFIKTYNYIEYLYKAKNNIYYAEQIINK